MTDRGGTRPGAKRGPYRKNPLIVARNEAIVALFLAGKTQTEIGALYGMRKTSVQKICTAAGYGAESGGEALLARQFREQVSAWRSARYAELSPDECHVWPWNYGSHGYGVIGRSTLAHRDEYCHYHGVAEAAISSLVIRHACDNPRCVNPLHLETGTQADNIRDMHLRGRNGWPGYAPISRGEMK